MPRRPRGHRPSGHRAAPFLLLLAAAGCGNTGTVSGRVTYKGEPVPGGVITFYGANGRTDSGRIEADGRYAVYQAPLGEVKVTVVRPKVGPPPRVFKGREPPRHPDAAGSAPAPSDKVMILPDRFKDPSTSGLTVTVKGGSQTTDIDLPP
jgi:hypothetical protein